MFPTIGERSRRRRKYLARTAGAIARDRAFAAGIRHLSVPTPRRSDVVTPPEILPTTHLNAAPGGDEQFFTIFAAPIAMLLCCQA